MIRDLIGSKARSIEELVENEKRLEKLKNSKLDEREIYSILLDVAVSKKRD